MELQIIHILLGKANPNRMNGVNKVVNSIAEHQALIGKDVAVWGITKNPVHDYPERTYTTRLFLDTGKFSTADELKEAIEQLAGENVIFHIHGGFIPQFYRIAKLLAKNKLEYVFTPHGAYNTVALKRSKWKKKVYIRLLESFLVQHAKHIHLIGESEIAGTHKTFGKVPYQLIPNGQDCDDNYAMGNSKKWNKSPVFGFVGRLDMHTKGLDTTLKGFAEYLRKEKNNSKLWLIGDGPDRAKLEKMARKLHIDKHMKFLGAKYGTEKDELVNQLDYLCLFSRNEGLPGVVMEAASIGVPVIVSKQTNLATYVQDSKAGFVAAFNNPAGITRALLNANIAMKENMYKDLGINARKMVKEKFNWSTIAQNHIQTYEAN